MPDMTNPAEMQKYFLSSVQKGEELLASGEKLIEIMNVILFTAISYTLIMVHLQSYKCN